MKTKLTLTQELVKKHFFYDPIAGTLIRTDKKNSRPLSSRYVSIRQNNFPTARVIYAYMVAEPYDGAILRIDRDPTNNKWSNFTTKQKQGNVVQRSRQKRPLELSNEEMMAIFKLETIDNGVGKRRTHKLWFLIPPEPVLVTRHTLRFKWKGIQYVRTKAHVMQRMMAIQSPHYSPSPKGLSIKEKRRETQLTKVLRKSI